MALRLPHCIAAPWDKKFLGRRTRGKPKNNQTRDRRMKKDGEFDAYWYVPLFGFAVGFTLPQSAGEPGRKSSSSFDRTGFWGRTGAVHTLIESVAAFRELRLATSPSVHPPSIDARNQSPHETARAEKERTNRLEPKLHREIKWKTFLAKIEEERNIRVCSQYCTCSPQIKTPTLLWDIVERASDVLRWGLEEVLSEVKWFVDWDERRRRDGREERGVWGFVRGGWEGFRRGWGEARRERVERKRREVDNGEEEARKRLLLIREPWRRGWKDRKADENRRWRAWGTVVWWY